MTDTALPLENQLKITQEMAYRSLCLWDLPADCRLKLINVSENITYRVTAPNAFRAILRVHRKGYHTPQAIESELLWIEALGQSGSVDVPGVIAGRNAAAVQTSVDDPDQYLVMFEHLPGDAPDESQDLIGKFERLGQIAAQCHRHVQAWTPPAGFSRMSWDTQTVYGPDATWGNWRDAPGVDDKILNTLNIVETAVSARLKTYGKEPTRFNLIHADMRLANLLVQGDEVRLIDFDDCGFGWFMYDFAAAISFMEDHPCVPDLKHAWVKGYRSQGDLPKADEVEIDTFIMLRRMALLAWIGSHIEAPEPQKYAPTFAKVTADLGQAWLDKLT